MRNLEFEIEDMGLTSSQDVIATDWRGKRLVMIPSSAGTDSRTVCWTSPLRPKGICIDNKDQIVVGLAGGVNISPIKLAIYSPGGETLIQEIGTDPFSTLIFDGAIQLVAQNTYGDYITAHNGSVLCLDKNGKHKWSYKTHSDVLGLVCDKQNNVIISEHNKNEIVMLSNDGKMRRPLLTSKDGISKPLALSIDRHDCLWIGQKNDVKIVEYL